MLNKIKEALKNLQMQNMDKYGNKAMYGRVRSKEVPDNWNYIVFNRRRIAATGTTGNDFTEYFEVHIIHEDYIPENVVYDVIKELETVQGLKKAKDDIVYNYAVRQETDTVVEMATITFCHALKGYKAR